jgi:hypothetical protein
VLLARLPAPLKLAAMLRIPRRTSMKKMPNKLIKSVRSAHPIAQELRTSCAAAY